MINFAWKKYTILVKKIGHDAAIKQLTKKELISIHDYFCEKHIREGCHV